jgi:cell division protein FtsL
MAFFSNFVDPAKLVYFPHFLDRPRQKSRPKDVDILFFASDNFHNQHGIQWFLEEIYPQIQDAKYKIVLAGQIVHHVERTAYPAITFIEHVDDPEDFYRRTRLVICPLLTGTGLKIKIVEAMAHGVPVVCTNQSLLGFPDKYQNGCLVADDPEHFAEGIHRVLQSESLRRELSQQGRNQYKHFFTWSSAKTVLSRVFTEPHRFAEGGKSFQPEFTMQVAKIKAERETLIAERETLINERETLINEREALINEREALITEREALTTEREALITEREALTTELSLTHNAYNRIVQSRSWRLTRPLRVMSQFLRKCGRLFGIEI